MDTVKIEDLPELFQGVANIFADNKDMLCEMDANMGDGDLGLTMNKGYGALPTLIKENTEPGDITKTLFKAGMKMSSLVPSTMGTLMSSGIMEGGKALSGVSEIDGMGMAKFLTGFAAGIQKRGKCQLGDRTILDSVDSAAKLAMQSASLGASAKEVMKAACDGAEAGVEATKDMIPKYGKAAVFSAKAKGIPDQGAVAGKLLMEGLYKYFE